MASLKTASFSNPKSKKKGKLIKLLISDEKTRSKLIGSNKKISLWGNTL
jgi:hypothetical protein